MKVSVIIPTFNRPDGLLYTLESVLNQTVKPDEIIIVNDNSSKHYPIKKYFKNLNEDIRLKYIINEETKGACYSRNRGARESSGDVLMFLDDDDAWENQKIERHLNILKKNPSVGLVYSGRKFVYDDDKNKVVKIQKPYYEGKLYPHILMRNVIGPTSSVSLRRNIFFEAGEFDVRFPAMQDYDLWIRCCKITNVKHDNDTNLIYTISRSNDQISGKSKNHIVAIRLFLEKYNTEINNLSFIKKRKVLSYRYRSVAISVKRKNYIDSLRWSSKATVYYPRIQDILLYLPPKIESLVRKTLHKIG